MFSIKRHTPCFPYFILRVFHFFDVILRGSDSVTPAPELRLRNSDSGTPAPCFPYFILRVFHSFDVILRGFDSVTPAPNSDSGTPAPRFPFNLFCSTVQKILTPGNELSSHAKKPRPSKQDRASTCKEISLQKEI